MNYTSCLWNLIATREPIFATTSTNRVSPVVDTFSKAKVIEEKSFVRKRSHKLKYQERTCFISPLTLTSREYFTRREDFQITTLRDTRHETRIVGSS